MKKVRKVSALAACAATLAVGAGLLNGGGAYADGGLTSIGVGNVGEGSQTCYLYYTGTSSSPNMCDATYGSYDAATSTITLGSGINEKSLQVNDSSESGNSYTIKTTSDISLEIFGTSLKATLLFDLGSYSLSGYGSGIRFPANGSVTLKSGTLNLSGSLGSVDDFTMESGLLNITETDETRALVVDNLFTMNGGKIKTKNAQFDVYNKAVINGGNIEMDFTNDGLIGVQYGFQLNGLNSTTEFDMNGGSVSISNGKYGIWATLKSTTINISGGELDISNTDEGIISSAGGNINFNGGITTISGSKEFAVDLRDSDDPKNDIAFGAEMGIMEPKFYVFWQDEKYSGENSVGYNWTGIVASNATVTIAEGGTVRRVYGWEIGDDNSEDIADGGSSVKVPNTGIFSGENAGAMIVAVSMGTLAALAGGAYVISYAVKRHSARVKFLKK